MKRLPLLIGPLFLACVLGAGERSDGIIRVAILENVESFQLSCAGQMVLVEINTGKRYAFDDGFDSVISLGPKGLEASDLRLQLPVRVMSSEKEKFLRVAGQKYRDTLLLRKAAAGSGMHVINEIGLDGYVGGILPREVSASWPAEALKAQAVVSRTFALHNLHRHDSEGYHLCSKVHCQVFGGLESEKPETTRAVEATHNEILLYGGEPANTFFFSNCGGRTEDPKGAWENSQKISYLKSVRCKYCKDARHYSWEKQVDVDDVMKVLLRHHFHLSPPISAIKVLSTDRSGRARKISIHHEEDPIVLKASKFRTMMGPNVIRSTFFTKIRKTRDGFVFKGKGWGHGVGLCQEGALGMALKGIKYKKILSFYYSGTKIKKFED